MTRYYNNFNNVNVRTSKSRALTYLLMARLAGEINIIEIMFLYR